MPHLFVAPTDGSWFNFLRARPDLDEVNFWQPGGSRLFKTIEVGQPFLFKLKRPHNAIAGGGFFVTASLLPVSFAWDTFGERNGVGSLEEFRHVLLGLRNRAKRIEEDFVIGCIILRDPFFFDRADWIPVPPDFAPNIVTGKRYDLGSPLGRDLWNRVSMLLSGTLRRVAEPGVVPDESAAMFGPPVLGRRRLHQGSFRVVIADRYGRRCAVSGERTLPVLDAAHIKPVTRGGLHQIDNGVLLRTDIHKLFDLGYVTVTPDYRFRVSEALRNDYQNGRIYYDYQNSPVRLPGDVADKPSRELLEWHCDTVFRR